MKFAVRYASGAVHDVETAGNVAVIGRDPTCDLVLNDPKSSRRHAVVESGPDALVIRDTGSANGISVNGKKTDRAVLKVGDSFRIGDVEITVLPAHGSGTLVMDDEAGRGSMSEGAPPNTATLPPLAGFPEPPRAAKPAASLPLPIAGATSPGRPAWPAETRPLTVTVLAVLWVLSIPFHIATGFALARSGPGSDGMILSALLVVLAVVAVLMAYGLWYARSWARPAQIALAALGILNCPFALASAAALAYMLRAPARRYFTHAGVDTSGDQAEAVFAAALVAAVVLGGLITAGLTIVARTARTGAIG